MADLTDEAGRLLDAYLAEVRSSLRHCPSVNAADVERDVREHVGHALAGSPAGVDAPELRDVLRGLGSPSLWVPPEDLNRLQRALLALRSGPEDLRLGYLAFGLLAATLLAAACLNVAAGPAATIPFLLLGAAASFAFARASLSAAGPGAAERWLIYPPLIAVYAPATALMLLWPPAAAVLAEMLLTDPGMPEDVLSWARPLPTGAIAAFSLATLCSGWWGLLGFAAWSWPAAVRDGYAPFASGFRPRPRGRLLGFSVACLLAFLALTAFAAGSLRGRTPHF